MSRSYINMLRLGAFAFLAASGSFTFLSAFGFHLSFRFWRIHLFFAFTSSTFLSASGSRSKGSDKVRAPGPVPASLLALRSTSHLGDFHNVYFRLGIITFLRPWLWNQRRLKHSQNFALYMRVTVLARGLKGVSDLQGRYVQAAAAPVFGRRAAADVGASGGRPLPAQPAGLAQVRRTRFPKSCSAMCKSPGPSDSLGQDSRPQLVSKMLLCGDQNRGLVVNNLRYYTCQQPSSEMLRFSKDQGLAVRQSQSNPPSGNPLLRQACSSFVAR